MTRRASGPTHPRAAPAPNQTRAAAAATPALSDAASVPTAPIRVPASARSRSTAAPTRSKDASSVGERGYVTAETAMILPVLVGISYALALVVVLVADQIRCADAAWEAARALARGVPSAQLPALASRYAPSGAHASSWTDGGSLTVTVERDQNIVSHFLPSVRIAASATVPCEPRVQGCQPTATDAPTARSPIA